MNRCITCHTPVSRIKAQVSITYNDHQYYACCPLCQTEFEKDPERYIEIAKVALGDYAVNAHTQTTGQKLDQVLDENLCSTSIIENLFKDSEIILKQFIEFESDFSAFMKHDNNYESEIATKLIEQFSKLRNRILIHTGACHFNLAMIKSENKGSKIEEKILTEPSKDKSEICH